jgi:putative transcriptional regulator
MTIRILLSARLGERKLSQAELARMTQIRASTINDYYWELSERVNLHHLDLICEALGCDISDLLVREPGGECDIRTKTGRPKRQ